MSRHDTEYTICFIWHWPANKTIATQGMSHMKTSITSFVLNICRTMAKMVTSVCKTIGEKIPQLLNCGVCVTDVHLLKRLEDHAIKIPQF